MQIRARRATTLYSAWNLALSFVFAVFALVGAVELSPPNPGGEPLPPGLRLGLATVFATILVISSWLAVRSLLARVALKSDRLVYHGYWRGRTVRPDQIAAVELGPAGQGVAPVLRLVGEQSLVLHALATYGERAALQHLAAIERWRGMAADARVAT